MMEELQLNPVFPIGGYHRRLLRVDLTRGMIRSEEISTDILQSFIGGTGLGINDVSFDYVVYLIPHVIPFHCKRI